MTKEAALSGFAKWRRDIADSIYEEISAMMSGHFIPYHKLCFMVAFLTALIFSILFTQMGVIEAPVAVVDLDHSARSAKFIQAVDSSRDIRIASVFHTPVDPVYLTRHDNVVGVIVIPKGFEKGLLNGTTPYNIGYEADMGNPAQNGEVFESLNQIAAQEGIPVNAENLQALGPASAQSSGSSGLTVSIRRLFNPTNSLVPVTIAGFLYFFSGIFFGITTLMLTGRVHVMGQWENAILNRGPSAMIARLIPYALGYTAAVTIMTAGLVLFNCMPFKGNYLAYLPSLFMLPFSIGLIAMLITWSFKTPANGASFMIFVVPPGFIMGGMTMAMGELTGTGWYFAHLFPLTWQYSMYRDFAFRGMTLSQMIGPYGEYILYVTALMMLVTLRFYLERRRLLRIRDRQVAALAQVPGEAA